MSVLDGPLLTKASHISRRLCKCGAICDSSSLSSAGFAGKSGKWYNMHVP